MGEADRDELPVTSPARERERDVGRPTSREAERGSRDIEREASRVRVIVPEWLMPPRTSS